MIFNKRAQLLALRETSIGVFAWEKQRSLWVSIEESSKSNLFSKVGIGVKSATFTLRKTRDISLHNAVLCGEYAYFLTDINKSSPILMELTAARIAWQTCKAFRIFAKKDEFKRPLAPDEQCIAQFPACLTEKYIGFKQQEPMAQTEMTFVLVTPKAIVLEVSDLVEIGAKKYAVQMCHRLDEFKNEYEITRKADA